MAMAQGRQAMPVSGLEGPGREGAGVRRVLRGAIRRVLLTAALVLSAAPVAARPMVPGRGRVVVAYVKPSDPVHGAIYRTLRRQRVLERLGAVVGLIRLPRHLIIRAKGCGGEVNAWYDPESHTLTMCYELVAGIIALAPHEASAAGVTREQAIRGPVAPDPFARDRTCLVPPVACPDLRTRGGRGRSTRRPASAPTSPLRRPGISSAGAGTSS